MKLKSGASLKGVQWEMFEAAIKVEAAFNAYGHECTITSGSDGQHMPRSLHYKGLAMDFRIRDVPVSQRYKIVKSAKSRLGTDFDVVLEKDHLHVELDPK
jgi:uncharacterized protein YcbK (DUF882 family)